MWIAARQSGDRLQIWVQIDGEISSKSTQLEGDATFEQALIGALDSDLADDKATPVICSGVDDGSFVQVPCAPSTLRKIASSDARLAVHALPCLAQAQPVDVMQGEEAAITGFLNMHPEWDGVLCMVGNCTRWVHVSAGEVVSFRSFMTAELHEVLSRTPTLRKATNGQSWDQATFDEAVSDAMSRPERFAATLFGIHAQTLLQKAGPAQANARLAGTLIGVELAAARPYWLGRDVALIGRGSLTNHYDLALKAQGVVAQVHEDEKLALAGFEAAFDRLAQIRG